jgi:hypothetical protein
MKRHHYIGLAMVLLIGASFMISNRKEIKPKVGEAEVEAKLAVNESPAEVSATATPVLLPKSAQKLEPKDQRKIVILQQILASHNDNDPRMDIDLKDLSPEVKKAMVGLYADMPTEKRNDRGTIVFLIARQIGDKADVDFLKSVLMEKPCLSLSDCTKSALPAGGETAHLEGISEVTANYPQLTAMKQSIEQYRIMMGSPEGKEHQLASRVLEMFTEATHSPNPKVVSEAQNALHYLTGHR